VATGALNFAGANVKIIRKVTLVVALTLLSDPTFGYGRLSCYRFLDGHLQCYIAADVPVSTNREAAVSELCQKANPLAAPDFCTRAFLSYDFENRCVAADVNQRGQLFYETGRTVQEAMDKSIRVCYDSMHAGCEIAAVACDGDESRAEPPTQVRRVPPGLDLSDLPAKILLSSLLAFFLFAILLVTRQRLINFVIHGALPYKATLPASDIQVSFTRKQRVNWYGRVVCGLVMQLALTEKQLALIRRYWLGRVVAFDSLRRQRQNRLAALYFQQARTAPATPKDDKLLSRVLACLRRFVLFVFWLIRSLISLLIGFLFIRVTIAKLVRGTLVESKDLLLLMEAKTAVEDSALYLKRYLELAETFDGRQDLYEPK